MSNQEKKSTQFKVLSDAVTVLMKKDAAIAILKKRMKKGEKLSEYLPDGYNLGELINISVAKGDTLSSDNCDNDRLNTLSTMGFIEQE